MGLTLMQVAGQEERVEAVGGQEGAQTVVVEEEGQEEELVEEGAGLGAWEGVPHQ